MAARFAPRGPRSAAAVLMLLLATATGAWAQAPAARPAPAGEGALQLKPASLSVQPAAARPAAAPGAAPAVADAGTGAIRVLLAPELETTLVSQIVGRISSLNASLGKSVPKGAAVVTFDCSEPSARLQMAQAEHAAAKETLDVKSRLHELEAAGQSEVQLAAAASDKANAAIRLSRAQIAQCTVVAPFAGRIVRLHVKPFQGVNAGAPLLEMVSEGPLKVRLNAPSRILRTLREGAPFEVSIDETGKTYQAKVTAINARVDAVAQTVELEGSIAGKNPELLGGMTGVARFKDLP